MSPIYFFPGLQLSQLVDASGLLRRDVLREFGLDEVLADVRHQDQASVFELASGGPGAAGGGQQAAGGVMLVALQAGEPPARLGYWPEHQAWRAVGDGRLLMGIDQAAPPSPTDLRRRKPLRGYELWLDSIGASVMIPVLRSPSGETSLPEDWGYDAAGKFTTSIRGEYVALWEASAEIWDALIARKEDARVSKERGLELCLQILSLNYRYGRHEQNLLHWVDSDNWGDILALAVDAPALKEYREQLGEDAQKKTPANQDKAQAQGSMNASPGSPASIPSIDRAEASSSSPPASASD